MDAGLQLDVGDALNLQPLDSAQDARYVVKVIGYLAGASLIVTAPRTRAGLVLVREGQPFAVRVLVESRVYGFTTHVLKSCSRPYPYLHLSYPRELESVVVRKAPRAATDLIVSIRRGGQEVPASARLIDISTAGARLTAPTPFAEVSDELDMGVRLEIEGIEEYLRLPACVRRRSEEPGEGGTPTYYFGVEFRALPQLARLALYAYVYSRLAG